MRVEPGGAAAGFPDPEGPIRGRKPEEEEQEEEEEEDWVASV